MPNDVILRPATAADAAVCRMLLPDACRSGLSEFVIAALPEPPYVAGAAAFLRLPGRLEGVAVHVIPGWRRRGIGSRLMREVLGRAAAGQATHGPATVSGWVDVLRDPGGVAFAERLGFARGARSQTAECDIAVAGPYFERFRTRWLARGGMPTGFAIRRLHDADRRAVARLWTDYIATRPGLRVDLVAAELGGPGVESSPVLLMGGEVRGFLLLRFEGDIVWVAGEVIAPEARDGFTTAALSVAAWDEARARGSKRVRFDWGEGVAYTANAARRLRGTVVRESVLMTRAVLPAEAG